MVYGRKLSLLVSFVNECAYNFGGKLTLEQAQVRSINKCLVDLPSHTSKDMQNLFKHVLEIWNHTRGSVQRFECEAVDIPELTIEVSS